VKKQPRWILSFEGLVLGTVSVLPDAERRKGLLCELSTYLADDDVIQGAFWDVVYVFGVAPVLDVAGFVNGLDYYLFSGFAQGQDKEYLIARWNIKGLLDAIFLYRSDDAAAQTFLRRTEHNALRGNPVVTANRVPYLGIIEDDDVGGGPFPVGWAGPIFEIACPGEVWKYQSILLRVAGEDVL
jgi:hypothetical protein